MIKIKVAGCRISVSEKIDDNIKEIKTAIDRAKVNGADILVTPECALSGYLWKPSDIEDPIIITLKQAYEEICQYSKKKGVDLVLGTGWVNKNNHWVNSQHFIVDGECVHIHEKLVLFLKETTYYTPGTEINTFMYKGCKVAGLICNDAWASPFVFPDASNKLLTFLSSEKVDVVFVSAHVPTDISPKKLFYDWHKIWLSMAAGTLKLNFVVSDAADPTQSFQAVCPVGVVSANSIWEVMGEDRGRSHFSHTIISNNYIPT